MNDRDRLLKAMAWLVDVYPSANIKEATVYAYVQDLEAFPIALIEAAIRDVSRNQFWPGLGEIIEKAAELYLDIPSYGEALRLVDDAASKGKPSELPEIVRAALDTVGGTYNWRKSETSAVLRSQFRDVYASDVADLKRAFTRGELELEAWPREQRPQLSERVKDESEVLPELTEGQRQENIERANELARRIGARPIPTE